VNSDERLSQLLSSCAPDNRKKILDLMSYCMGVDPKASFQGDPWGGEPGDKKLAAKAKTLAKQLITSHPELKELVELVLELSNS